MAHLTDHSRIVACHESMKLGRLCELIIDVRTDRPRVGNDFSDHRPRVRIRVLAVTQQFVKHHADCEKVGRDVPSRQICIWRLVGRVRE